MADAPESPAENPQPTNEEKETQAAAAPPQETAAADEASMTGDKSATKDVQATHPAAPQTPPENQASETGASPQESPEEQAEEQQEEVVEETPPPGAEKTETQETTETDTQGGGAGGGAPGGGGGDGEPPKISLAPASLNITAGGAGTLTVTITPPQSSETVVSLASSSPAVVSVPASVPLPAGQSSATFEATGASAGTATIDAKLPDNLGGGAASTAVTVDGAPPPPTPSPQPTPRQPANSIQVEALMGRKGIIGIAVYLSLLSIILLTTLLLSWPTCEPPTESASAVRPQANENSNRDNNTNLPQNANANRNTNQNTNAGRNANQSTNTNATAPPNTNVNQNGNQNGGTQGPERSRPESVGEGDRTDGDQGYDPTRPPVIASVSPMSGPVSGNIPVTIKGKNFHEKAEVTFGGVRAESVKVQRTSPREASISATAPAHAQGEVEVVVTNPADGTNVEEADRRAVFFAPGFTYTCNVPTDLRLLWIIILAGALGGLLHAMRSFFWYVGNRKFVRSWFPMYLMLPFNGALMAVVFYAIVRGGYLDSTPTNASAFVIIALAFLVGMFSQQASLKLRQIANAVFTEPGPGEDSKQQPTLTPEGQSGEDDDATTGPKMSPSTGPKAGGTPVRISGKNLSTVKSASFGGAEAAGVKFNEQTSQLELTTPPHAPGDVPVVLRDTAGKEIPCKLKFTYT